MKEQDIFELVSWYQKNKRDLPWRHTKNSYKIWISEIMLQQTRVEAVKDYYKRFLDRLPTIKDLAEISDDELMKLWEGLGYYSRARNLKKCAQVLVSQGLDNLPSEESELSKLPGIGPYTTGAILSIAYLKPIPAIDGNVIRVLSRILMDEREINQTVQREYNAMLRKWMPLFPCDDFTQSFIELGALICIPNGAPKCLDCPLNHCCKAHQNNQELLFPKKKEKKEKTIIDKTVLVFKYQNTYSILKRTSGVLQGMYEFPNLDENFTLKEVKKYLKQNNIGFSKIQELNDYKHVFSHMTWNLKSYLIELKEPLESYIFVTKEEMTLKYSIPSAFQKIVQIIN